MIASVFLGIHPKESKTYDFIDRNDTILIIKGNFLKNSNKLPIWNDRYGVLMYGKH